MTIRSVNERFWSDGWIRSINPLDRYLFLYFLTNEHTTWCGIYELDLGMMAFESGLDKEELVRSMLPKLHPKVIYQEGWVCIPNWIKYHTSESGTVSPQQKKGYENSLRAVPDRIRGLFVDYIPYAYRMDTLSPSASAFTSTSASSLKGASNDALKESIKEIAGKKRLT